MPNPDVYADFVEFSVQIVAGTLLAQSLALSAMIAEFDDTASFPGRTELVSGTPEQIRSAVVDLGFSQTSETYKQVSQFVNNVQPVGEVLIGRLDAADASLTAGLTAIVAENDEFFGFTLASRSKPKQIEAFSWAQQRKNKFFVAITKDSLALSEDPASITVQLKALGIEFGMLVWYDAAAATKYGPAVVKTRAQTFKVPAAATLKLRVDGGSEQMFTFNSAPATFVATSAGPYTVGEGDALSIEIDGGATLSLVWEDDPTYFPNGLANPITALEAADYIEAKLPGVTATVGTGGDAGKLVIQTVRRGTGASIQVLLSDVATALTLAVDTEVGTGFASNADVATAAEVAALVDATITDAAADAIASRMQIRSTTLGEDASIEITGGTLVDELGLLLDVYKGSGTLENYLDCQLLGRVAGFDLDAPGGSVGWDDQTVPTTPGNTLTNTQRKALWRQNCNTYERVTSNRPGELHRGVTPAGFDCDVVWSGFWFRVRGSERVKAMQDAAADVKQRIPWSEPGLAKYDQVLRNLMLDGARNGHIQGPDLLPKDPTGVRKTYFTTPTIAQQTPSDRAAQRFSGFETYQLASGSGKAIRVGMFIQTP